MAVVGAGLAFIDIGAAEAISLESHEAFTAIASGFVDAFRETMAAVGPQAFVDVFALHAVAFKSGKTEALEAAGLIQAFRVCVTIVVVPRQTRPSAMRRRLGKFPF